VTGARCASRGQDIKLFAVIIVEAHRHLRQAIRSLVDHEPELEVVATAASVQEAVGHLSTFQLDVLLVDMSLLDASGPKLIKHAREELPNIVCIVLSDYGRELNEWTAGALGADACVTKYEPERLIPTIQQVLHDKAA
jgi:DNA-binding NarL/FixJ family response regulator